MLTSIEGRSLIVTGESRGIGKGIGACLPLRERGYLSPPGILARPNWHPLRFAPRRIRLSGMRVISPNLLNCRDADQCSLLISQHAEVLRLLLQLLKELGSPSKSR